MNETRDETLLRLRPAVEAQTGADPENSPGHFQHAVLRPILKLQNGLLLAMYRHYIDHAHAGFGGLTRSKREAFITNSLQRDIRLRNQVVGIVVGQFTAAEWTIFASAEQELTRRIIQLAIRRLCDQAEQLAGQP